MIAWRDVFQSDAVGALVPEVYAPFRPAVVDGLVFFLDGLPAPRAAAILADQLSLPPGAGIEARLVAFVRHSPVLHKLGQVLARDRRLPPSLRLLLQTLETMAPSLDADHVRFLVAQELDSLEDQGIRFDGPPLAEASVAVVIPFRFDDNGSTTQGVFKVLKPGIETALAEDLRLLRQAGHWLDERCHAYGLPDIPYGETFSQVSDLLEQEVHLSTEQTNLSKAHTAFAHQPSVVVPALFEQLSTPRLTAMGRVFGRKVTDVTGEPWTVRARLAATIAEALVAHPIWSAEPDGVFHADPHAGNLILTDDGKLALLDWSLAGSLGKDARVCVTDILVGALTLDSLRIARAITGLADAVPDPVALRALVDDHLRRLGWPRLPGAQWLTGMMDDTVLKAGVRFSGDLLLFRKALLTVSGVAADVSDAIPLEASLAASFLTRLWAEGAFRTVMPPTSQAFGTHLSTLDLTQALVTLPFTPLRYWGLIGRHPPRDA